MARRTERTIILILMLHVPICFAGDAKLDIHEILVRTAENYRAAVDYRIEVESKVSVKNGDAVPTHTRLVLTCSGPKRCSSEQWISGAVASHRVLGTDGEEAWGWLPDKKQYALEAAEALHDIIADLQENRQRYFRKFELLDRIGGQSSIRSTHCAMGPCYQVRIDPGQKLGWTEEIWIDSARYVVVKSRFIARTLFETTQTVTRWKTVDLDARLGDREFKLDPPAGATRVHNLRLP